MQKLLPIIRSRNFIKTVIYLLVFICIYLLAQIWVTREKEYGPAPEVQGLTLQGKTVSLQELSGKPTLLYFWASWCPICRLEHGTINNLSEDYQVLSIAMQSGTDEEVRLHMQEEGVFYPTINDPDGLIASRYGIRGVPTGFILDAQGNVRSKATGYTLESVLRFRLWRLQGE